MLCCHAKHQAHLPTPSLAAEHDVAGALPRFSRDSDDSVGHPAVSNRLTGTLGLPTVIMQEGHAQRS